MGTIINMELPPAASMTGALWAVETALGAPAKLRVSERVLVAEFDGPVHPQAVHSLSKVLGEDCIAVLPPDGKGYLAGPRAAAWEPFDITKFKRL